MTSIIITFYERLSHLKCCLDALSLCSKDFDEVVITDDGSKDATVNNLKKLIASYTFPITYVSQPKQGFRSAAARNNGIRHSRGDYLIFLDCDFLVLPGTIQYHLNMAKSGRFIAGACKYLTEEQSRIVLDSTLSSDLIEQYYGELPDKELIVQHRRFIKRTLLIKLHLASPVKQSLGGHLSLYKKDIEYINGYNENFTGWGGEDEDLGIRLVAAGIHGISAVRYARVLHVWHPSELKKTKNIVWRTGTLSDYFHRKKIPFVCENGLKKL
jgi:glycosyltransferase involved in cell wall biosynthesis